MNKQVIEYVEINVGLFGTNTRILRNPILCQHKYCSSWGRPRVRIEGAAFFGQSIPALQASYLIKDVNGMEFFNFSGSYFV